MYWFGSVGCVGAWFWGSLTSNVRKSFAVISDELLAAALALLDDCVLPDVSLGACTARREDSEEATVCAADVPDVATELSCDKSIISSPYFKFAFLVPIHARTLNQLPPAKYVPCCNVLSSSNPSKLPCVTASSDPPDTVLLAYCLRSSPSLPLCAACPPVPSPPAKLRCSTTDETGA